MMQLLQHRSPQAANPAVRQPLPTKHPIAPVRFGGAPLGTTLPKQSFGQRLLQHFDYREFGVSHVNQIQIIYASCILWRLLAANERRKASPNKSWNEIRESALRDSIGYAFWFFGTPLLQRAYLKLATRNNPDLEKALIQRNPNIDKGTGRFNFLNKLNPLTSLNIPTSEQVKDQMAQALHDLKKSGVDVKDAAYQNREKYYKELMKHRNLATAVGLGSTILLLGIGINFINFYMTSKNVARRNAAKHKPSFPPVPPLPHPFNFHHPSQHPPTLSTATHTPAPSPQFQSPQAMAPFALSNPAPIISQA